MTKVKVSGSENKLAKELRCELKIMNKQKQINQCQHSSMVFKGVGGNNMILMQEYSKEKY